MNYTNSTNTLWTCNYKSTNKQVELDIYNNNSVKNITRVRNT